MKKKIAIIGANDPLIPFFKQTKDLGFEIHCFAWAENAVCKEYSDFFYPISFTNKGEILKICKNIGIDGITSFSLESALPTVNFVAQKLNLPGNPAECENLTANKYSMREQLRKCGISIPYYHVVDSAEELKNLVLEFPVIVKPVDSGGSRGVTKISNLDQLKPAFIRACGFSSVGRVLVEQFIDGREFSVEFISHKGEHHFISITDKITTGPPCFVELEHHQPAQISNAIAEKIIQITRQTLDALKIYSSASHTEVKVDTAGDPYIIEIGARMGGDMITSDLVRLSAGYDFVKGLLDLVTDQFTPPNFTKKKHSGVYYLSKETEKLRYIMDNSNNFPQIYRVAYFAKPIIQVEQSDDRAGYFIYQSDTKFHPQL